ncbi:MAG: hypothetical protein HY900_23150, partial [Deltaproteobacteria bacterium]|nr:hypothetical protein [Deltaproteobacteria bacterium]
TGGAGSVVGADFLLVSPTERIDAVPDPIRRLVSFTAQWSLFDGSGTYRLTFSDQTSQTGIVDAALIEGTGVTQ